MKCLCLCHVKWILQLVLAGCISVLWCSCVHSGVNDFRRLGRPSSRTENPGGNYYVSLQGDDRSDGSLEHPFRTLERAQRAVREDRRRCIEPLTVHVRGGCYRITSPLSFGPWDGGSAGAPVTWQSYGDEQAVISGGQVLDGWENCGGVWRVRVPSSNGDIREINQLFVDGQRRPRCRLPKTGFYRIERTGGDPRQYRADGKGDPRDGDSFVYHEGDLLPWEDIGNGVLTIYGSWVATMFGVTAIDAEQRLVSLASRSGSALDRWERGNTRYFIENVRAALTSPGEWYVDYGEGELYYMPMKGETIDGIEAVLPVAYELLSVAGDSTVGLPVEHLVFSGLTFSHNGFKLNMKHPNSGQSGIGADMTGAIHVRDAHHCTFEDLTLEHLGTYGIWLDSGCDENLVNRVEIKDMGAGGIIIGIVDCFQEKRLEFSCGRNSVVNCLIYDGGKIIQAGAGVVILQSSGNVIRHCDISDMYYTGVSVGWSWGYASSRAHHNIIEYNHIHHIGAGMLNDMGGVYTLGVSPGTVVRGNFIHDVYSYGYGGWGLYTDEGSSGIVMEDNVVYRCKHTGFHQHYGRDNVIRHNIFAMNGESGATRSRREAHESFVFEDNVVVTASGAALSGNVDGGTVFRNNLYYATEEKCLFGGMPFWYWQAECGQDAGSVIADPGFANAVNGDFTLKAAAAAEPMVQEAVRAWKTAGLTGPIWWRERAEALSHRACIPEMKAVPKEFSVLGAEGYFTDTFSKEAAGDAPAQLKIMAEDEPKGAVIRIAEGADVPGGRRAVKFVDQEGLSHAFVPYAEYHVIPTKGVVQFKFNVFLASEHAELWHEWRDSAAPYNIGPTLCLLGTGEVKIGNELRGKVEPRQWLNVAITATVGGASAEGYSVSIVPEHGESVSVSGVRFPDPDWKVLTKLLFVSNGTSHGELFISDVIYKVIDAPIFMEKCAVSPTAARKERPKGIPPSEVPD